MDGEFEPWHLWAVLAVICLFIAGFCEAEARHGFSKGTYGAGFRGLPSDVISGDAAFKKAKEERLKAIVFSVGAVALGFGAWVSARRRA